MEKSHLRQLILSFSSAEKREIRKFLGSPFFNQRQDVVQLFDWFCAQEAPEKTAAKQRLFGKTVVDDQELRLRMTYLSRLLERYIAQKEFDADDTARQFQLAVGLRKRGLEPQFERARKTLEKSLESQSLRDARYHDWQFRLQWETHQSTSLRNPTDLQYLYRASDEADAAYVALKLRLICLSLAHQGVYSQDYQAIWESEVVDFAEKIFAGSHPAIAIYLHCYRMMREPENEAHFHRFKTLLLDGSGHFSNEEVHSLFIWAVNYCVRRLNAGETRYFQELTDLYKAGLESGILLENGVLSRFTYLNVVATGLRTGELDWVRVFIYQYKNNLEKPYRESTFSFSLARLEFALKRYHAVLDLLQHANYRDVLVNLSTKTLLLKTWFELDEHDILQSHLDAMKNYIHRKRVIGYHRTNYLNILKYTAKLLNINRMDTAEVARVRAAMQAEEHLTEREWLLEKLG